MQRSRRLLAGTGWKMNLSASEVPGYAAGLRARLAEIEAGAIDIFVLPPFTSLAAASGAFAGSKIAIGGQNMHWDEAGAWTGEISAPMLVEAGCRYVELAHSERLQHFGETYERVRQKLDRALGSGLTPILCLGETADEKRTGRSDEVLAAQLTTALAGQPIERVSDVVLAYEPRWAIGSADAATPDYVAARHAALRAMLRKLHGVETAARTRIVYGGSVTPENGPDLIDIDDVDGLFVGRAAWKPEGFAKIIAIVAEAARRKTALVAR
jgi:triosephosphate isomerase